MDLNKVLAELITERNLIDDAIAHLEKLSTGTQGVSTRPEKRAQPAKPQEKTRAAGGNFD